MHLVVGGDLRKLDGTRGGVALDERCTVFAPTDAAFAKLTAVPTGDALKNVLLYHVVSGKVLSTDLTAGSVPTLLTGKSLTISLTGGAKVNDVPIDVVDVVTTNGVIHVIGTVLSRAPPFVQARPDEDFCEVHIAS